MKQTVYESPQPGHKTNYKKTPTNPTTAFTQLFTYAEF